MFCSRRCQGSPLTRDVTRDVIEFSGSPLRSAAECTAWRLNAFLLIPPLPPFQSPHRYVKSSQRRMAYTLARSRLPLIRLALSGSRGFSRFPPHHTLYFHLLRSILLQDILSGQVEVHYFGIPPDRVLR